MLGPPATIEPMGISLSLWGRWRSLDDCGDAITSLWKQKSMTIEGRVVCLRTTYKP